MKTSSACNPAHHGRRRHPWLRVAIATLVLSIVLPGGLLGGLGIVRAALTLTAGAVHWQTNPLRLGVDFSISGPDDKKGLTVALWEGTVWVDDKPATSSEWFFILPHPGAYTLKLTRDSDGTVLSAANVTASHAPHVLVTSRVEGNEGAEFTFGASGSDDDTPWGDTLYYNWSWGENPYLVPDSGFSTSPTATHTFLDSGSYTVILTVRDRAGLTAFGYVTAIVNNLPPTAAFSVPPTAESGLPFTLELSAAWDLGLFDRDTLQYAFDCGNGSGYGAWANWGDPSTYWSHTQSCTMTGGCGASRTVKAKIRDRDGDESEYTRVVSVPDSPPTISPSRIKADGTPYHAGHWTNQDVIVVWRVSDDCGIADDGWPQSVTVSAEGIWTVSGTVKDTGGHSVTATSGLIKIDKTPPTITASATTADNKPYTAGTWTDQAVTVHFTCTDDGSGVDSRPANVVVSDEGTTTIERSATDNAGNSATASFGPIMISVGPVVVASATNEDGTAYSAGTWTKQSVTVRFECSDAGSGIALCPADVVVSAQGVTDCVSGTATDNLGHETTVTFGPIKVDKTMPTLAWGTASPTANAAGWHNSDVALPFTAGDALSGVATTSITSPLVLAAEGSAVTSTVMVTDVAGNSETFTSPSFRIDKTAPVLTCPANITVVSDPGQSGAVVTFTVNVSDICPGVIAVAAPASGATFSLGTTTVHVTASDAAGNSAVCSFAVTVNAPSEVTGQPSDVTVCAGREVSFSAAASGYPAPTVQWQASPDNGAHWADVPLAISTTLTFAATADRHGHQYRAVFTNTVNTVASDAATLTVNTTPLVGTQPYSQTVVHGQPVTFDTSASGRPVPTVQWQVSTDGGASWNPIVGETSPTLAFTASRAQSGNRYRAVFASPAGCGSVNTNAVVLTVDQAQTTTVVSSAPATAVYGQSVTLTATVTAKSPGSGTPTGTVTFLDGATTLGSVALDGGGVATLTTSALSVGTHTITAQYAGNAQYLGASGAANVQVNPVPLDVVKSDGRDWQYAAWAMNYVITVTNHSIVDALGVAVTDTLPADTYVPGLPKGTREIIWQLGTVPAGTSRTLRLTAHTISTVRGVITNTVLVSGVGVETVTASDETEIRAAPTLTPTATHTPTATATATTTASPSATATRTTTPTATASATVMPSATPSVTPSATATPTASATPEPSATPTQTSAATATPSLTAVPGDLALRGTVYVGSLDGGSGRRARASGRVPVAGALVRASLCVPRTFEATTGEDGSYLLTIAAGDASVCDALTIEVTATGYVPIVQTFQVSDLRAQPVRDLALLPVPGRRIWLPVALR